MHRLIRVGFKFTFPTADFAHLVENNGEEVLGLFRGEALGVRAFGEQRDSVGGAGMV